MYQCPDAPLEPKEPREPYEYGYSWEDLEDILYEQKREEDILSGNGVSW